MTARRLLGTGVALALMLVACGTGQTASPSSAANPSVAEPPVSSPSATATPASAEPSPSPTPPSPIGSYPELSEAPLAADVAERLQGALDAAVERGSLGAIAAAVIVPGEGAWSGAAGTTPDGAPLTPDAQFAIASVTKTVVAAQVLTLVEQGLIGLDDEIADHLPPDLEVDANGATVRELLSMLSGLAHEPERVEPDIVEAPAHAHAIGDWLPLVGPPEEPAGQSFFYNNVNYVLLGAAVEHVTEQPLATVLRDGVLSGDGLERLVYQDAERPQGPLVGPGEFEDFPVGQEAIDAGGGFLPSRAVATTAGAAGGMASDAISMARWGYQLYGGFVLDPEHLALATDVEDGYGLGCHPVTEFGLRGIGHQGEVPGYRSLLYADRATGTIIALLVNDNRWSPGITTADLMRALASS